MKYLFFITLFFPHSAICESPDNDRESVCNSFEDENCKNKAPIHTDKDFSQEPQISQSGYEKARQSVWKISNKKKYGTAFAINSNQIITDFHVVFSKEEPLKNEDIKDFFLSQEGNPHNKVQANRILAISVPFDLVLIETVESLPNHLIFADSFSHQDEDTFIFGYPGEIFRQVNRIEGTFYTSQHFHSFPVHTSNLNGISGSPLLNSEGDIIGTIFMKIGSNLTGVIDLNSLRNFTSGKTGTSCFKKGSSETMSTEDCIQTAKKDTEKIIEDKSNPLAPYQWAHFKFTDSHKTRKKLFKMACEGGFMMGCVLYGFFTEELNNFTAQFFLHKSL